MGIEAMHRSEANKLRYTASMSRTKERLEELLALPEQERMQIANALLDSLDEESAPDWEEAWATELVKRVEGARSGEREGIDSETAHARVLERLRSVRR